MKPFLVLLFFLTNKASAQTRNSVITFLVQMQTDSQPNLGDDAVADSIKGYSSAVLNRFGTSRLYFWREGDEVVSKEDSNGKLYKRYHVQALQFTIEDSTAYNINGKTERTQYSLDYRRDKNWKVHYTVKRQRQTKSILGHKCHLYRIKEYKQWDPSEIVEERSFEIWATLSVRPAISVHAVMGFYAKVLPNLTPLEMTAYLPAGRIINYKAGSLD